MVWNMRKRCNLQNPSPGAYLYVENEAYHAAPGLSASNLKPIVQQSPLHAHYKHTHPEDFVQNDSMRIGDAVHILTLQPKRANDLIGIQPKFDRRTKEGKRLAAEWEEKGKQYQVVVTQEELDKAQAMRDALMSDAEIERLIGMITHVEASIWDVDKDTGLLVKTRPDGIAVTAKAVLDLKTMRDASPEGFTRQAFSLKYHLQAHGQVKLTAKHVCPVEHYIYLCVENEKPYATACYYADELYLELGKEDWDGALLKWAECASSGQWPSYSTGLMTLSIPSWVKAQRRRQEHD